MLKCKTNVPAQPRTKITNVNIMVSSGIVMSMKDGANNILNEKERRTMKFHGKGEQRERIDKTCGVVEKDDPKKRDKEHMLTFSQAES